MDLIRDEGGRNIGFKNLDAHKELQELRKYISQQYDCSYLPSPFKKDNANKNNLDSDFSDSSESEEK